MSAENQSIDRQQRARISEWELPAEIVEQLTHHEQVVRAAAHWGLVAPSAAGRRSLEKAALVRVRCDQVTLSDAEREALNRALATMVAEGIYDALAHLDCDARHNMTGAQGVIGLHRFLPWHRRLLWEFESQLQRIDCRLRPNQLPLALPYWNWAHPLPDWLVDFSMPHRPAHDASRNHTAGQAATLGSASASPASRTPAPLAYAPASSPLKPTPQDIWLILHGFARQLPTSGVSDFVKFTYALEGWGRRPDGTSLPGHNQVRAWLESVVRQPTGRPIHPIYWLHLAQVDRLWSLWQIEHRGSGPSLVGRDRVLDPWPETVDDMLNPLAIGYAYDV